MRARSDVCLNIHKFAVWSCTCVIDLSLHEWHTQKQTNRHTHTHLVANIHQCCPQCFLLLSTASRCHIERKLGSCWTAGSGPGCPHVKYTNTRTHTLCLHTNIHSLMYTQKRWHTLTAAGVPQFSDRPTEDCWLYTHTTVLPTGLELHQSL